MRKNIDFIILFLLATILCAGCSQKSTALQPVKIETDAMQERLWKDTDTSYGAIECPGRVLPLSFRILDVDTAVVKRILVVQGPGPGVISKDTVLIEIPLPDGSWEQFRINQVQVMAPELAAKYPYLKTYAGSSVVYPADQLRLEVNPDGLRVMMLSSRGTILLEPLCKDDKIHMISFFKKNLPEGLKEDFERK